MTTSTATATGTFELHDWLDTPYDVQDGAQLSKAQNRKVFHGDIEGESAAELLFVAVPTDEPGKFLGTAYVGVERITGRVHGHGGSFVVVHKADVATGMTVSVVAGSATGELAGLTGELRIDRAADGSHTYAFEYQLG